MVASCLHNPSIWEVGVGEGSPEVQSQPSPHSELQVSQGYEVTPVFDPQTKPANQQANKRGLHLVF